MADPAPPPRPDFLGFQLRRTCPGGQKVYIRRQFPPQPVPFYETPGTAGFSSLVEIQGAAKPRNNLSSEIEEV